jgi:hypothetical protein
MRLDKMDKSYLDIFNCVSERTKVAILALSYFSGVHVAKLSLVFIFVIQTFDSIVCTTTIFIFRASVCLSKFAKLWCVKRVISSLVLNRMIVVACLVIVW